LNAQPAMWRLVGKCGARSLCRWPGQACELFCIAGRAAPPECVACGAAVPGRGIHWPI